MIEIQHDISLVTASIFSALIACYLIIRIKNLLQVLRSQTLKLSV